MMCQALLGFWKGDWADFGQAHWIDRVLKKMNSFKSMPEHNNSVPLFVHGRLGMQL